MFFPIVCRAKHLDEAYKLWLPFGLIGLHHFYLRRPGEVLANISFLNTVSSAGCFVRECLSLSPCVCLSLCRMGLLLLVHLWRPRYWLAYWLLSNPVTRERSQQKRRPWSRPASSAANSERDHCASKLTGGEGSRRSLHRVSWERWWSRNFARHVPRGDQSRCGKETILNNTTQWIWQCVLSPLSRPAQFAFSGCNARDQGQQVIHLYYFQP